jgi:hypothetical protein
MESYRQASAHTIRAPRSVIFKPSTPEEMTTHRNWARIVLMFYCCLFICTCTAILAISSIASPERQVVQASPQKNPSTQAGR